MSTYIHFTEEQKERAATVDLEYFLRQRGEKLLSSGRDKRLASDHSVTIRGCQWFDHDSRQGGNAISFVRFFYNRTYPEAVTMLLDEMYPCAPKAAEEPPKPFALPPVNSDMRRVYAYLVKHRNISRDVVAHFARKKLLYEDAKYHNAVFVGTDETGVPRHAHKRSTNSSGKAFRLNVEGCDPRYTFHHMGTDGSLYVFEAPIDMLAYISMHKKGWENHSYVALCSTSDRAALQMLKDNTHLKTVYLCLDNDNAGLLGCKRIADSVHALGDFTIWRVPPQNKDWDEDLKALNGREAIPAEQIGSSETNNIELTM